MIPADVDLDDLNRQLGEDAVAFGAFVPEGKAADLEPGLLDAVAHARDTDFGALGLVILERTPPQTADMRDVAQELLMSTDLDTVIVRAPHSGAVVSDVHSRAGLEVAQYPFLGNPDVVGAAHRFVDDVNASAASWPSATALILLGVAGTAAFTALGARRRRRGIPKSQAFSTDGV
ncbi:hypothetical protein NYP18_07540 [Corynebacterium sp. YIM 101645]|uniref:1-deoxy-D-xylulose-5-phosphate synthase n=1 Tax=Corynebacterium lemuris TaxID=1859292 RepID=A0ABT2FW87_9CORY|nr:DUF6676 family protein [Corynebacterium lemuris]MCS5479507.1 hypothetical protein [Corynebacterium lemuris]